MICGGAKTRAAAAVIEETGAAGARGGRGEDVWRARGRLPAECERRVAREDMVTVAVSSKRINKSGGRTNVLLSRDFPRTAGPRFLRRRDRICVRRAAVAETFPATSPNKRYLVNAQVASSLPAASRSSRLG